MDRFVKLRWTIN